MIAFLTKDPPNEAHALAAAALVAPALALYVPLGMAPLFIILTVLCLGLGILRLRRLPPWFGRTPETLILAGFLAWAALSAAAWALDRPAALRSITTITAIFIGGVIVVNAARSLGNTGRDLVRTGLVLGLGLGLVLSCCEIYLGGPVGFFFPPADADSALYSRRLSRGLTLIVLLLVPALVAAWRLGWRKGCGALALLGILAIGGGHPLSAKIALGLAPFLFLAGWRRLRRIQIAATGVVLTLILGFPLLAQLPTPQETMNTLWRLPNSAHHRLTIWNFTAQKVMEKPLFGWGMEASRSVPGAEDTVVVTRFRPVPYPSWVNGYEITEQRLPLHPHNGAGQIWLELGAVGIAILSAFLVMLRRRIGRFNDPIDAGTALSSFGGTLVVASVSYGVWQNWWLCSLWVSAALTTAIMREKDIQPPR